MKHLQFTTSKVKGLIVELPEGATPQNVACLIGYKVLWYKMPFIRGYSSFELPKGNWGILNFLSLLTDEQKEQVCENYEILSDGMFKNYNAGYPSTLCVSESFDSLIESIGVLTENEIKKPNPLHYSPQNHRNGKYKRNSDAYNLAESKTFKNGLILIEKIN